MRIFPVVLSLFCAGSVAFAANATSLKLPRGTPESQGVSSGALLGFVAAAEEKIDALHSVMIVRHGQVIAEGWWAPYSAGDRHELYSLSKSFTSTAVGLAVESGKLSVEDPVLKFFPDEAPEKPSTNLRAMRVRDLLTMATGHHQDDIQKIDWASQESLVKKFLALPVTHKPGTFFVYNTPATYMLSAIVQKVTGQTVLDYLRPRLFEPLGIENPTWDASKQGVSFGGFGLSIRTEDIARFGQLYLQRGQWRGKQLVPAAWVDSATSRWMSNGSTPTSDWEQGYGFQFWRCRHGVIRGDGAHGQFCIIFPQHDTVVAITAGTRDLQGVLNVVWEKLLPALQSAALPADAAAHAKLKGKLEDLSLRTPVAVETAAAATAVSGKRYVLAANTHAIESFSLRTSTVGSMATELTVSIGGSEQRITLTPGTWHRDDLKGGPSAGPIAASGAWTASDTFSIDMVRYLTPFSMRYQLKFEGEKVTLSATPNVGPAVTGLKAVVGRHE